MAISHKMFGIEGSAFRPARRTLLGLALAGLVAVGLAPDASLAQEKLKVAAIFSTPIEEPWVNQIHEALLKAEEELGIEYKWAESVRFGRLSRACCANSPATATSSSPATPSRPRTSRAASPRNFPRRRLRVRLGPGAGRAEFLRLRQLDPRAGLSLRHDRRQDDQVEHHRHGRGDGHSRRWRGSSTPSAPAPRRSIPAVKCKVTFIGSFFDPPKAKEAALAQIDAGVDVIYAERFGVIEAAQEKGILAISNMSDQSSLAPDTVITGPVWDMWPTIQAAVKQVQAGVYTAQDFGSFSFMAEGGARLAPFHDWETKLPADVHGAGRRRRSRRSSTADFRVPVEREHAGFGVGALAPSPSWRGLAEGQPCRSVAKCARSARLASVEPLTASAAPSPAWRERTRRPPPLVAMRGISKRFGAVQAVDGVDLTLQRRRHPRPARRERRRQDHADERPLRHLCGRCRHDRGRGPAGRDPQLRRRAEFRHRHGAPAFRAGAAPHRAGEPAGRPGRAGRPPVAPRRDRAARRDRPRLSPRRSIPTAWSATFRSASSSGVEIAKSLVRGARILVLDEPTATLTPREADGLFRALRAMAARGMGVIFISHKLGEVLDAHQPHHRHAPRPRRGASAANDGTLSKPELARLMCGRDLDAAGRSRPSTPGAPLLVLDGVSTARPGRHAARRRVAAAARRRDRRHRRRLRQRPARAGRSRRRRARARARARSRSPARSVARSVAEAHAGARRRPRAGGPADRPA